MSDVKAAVEVMRAAADYPTQAGCQWTPKEVEAVRTLLSAYAALEADRDLLRAECRAWRAMSDHDNDEYGAPPSKYAAWKRVKATLAAVDEAGALGNK